VRTEPVASFERHFAKHRGDFAPGLDGKAFHLVDPEPKRVGELLNVFARAGHAPPMTLRINTKMFGFIPSYVLKGVVSMPPIRRFINAVLKDLGIPRELFQFINFPARFDVRQAGEALDAAGITCPPVESYAPVLWDYWERHMDPDLFVDRSLSGKVRGKVAVVTGASSGIGQATATRLAAAGAKTILVARTPEKLEEAQKEIGGGHLRLGEVDRLLLEQIRGGGIRRRPAHGIAPPEDPAHPHPGGLPFLHRHGHVRRCPHPLPLAAADPEAGDGGAPNRQGHGGAQSPAHHAALRIFHLPGPAPARSMVRCHHRFPRRDEVDG